MLRSSQRAASGPATAPLRRRPCPADAAAPGNHSDPSLQLRQPGVVPRGALWEDPMPSAAILGDYRARRAAAAAAEAAAAARAQNATNATAA